MTPSGVTFSDVTADDFEELAALRIAAMRASLEQVGRFDPERARERLRKSFYPEHTKFVILDGQRIGFSLSAPQKMAFTWTTFTYTQAANAAVSVLASSAASFRSPIPPDAQFASARRGTVLQTDSIGATASFRQPRTSGTFTTFDGPNPMTTESSNRSSEPLRLSRGLLRRLRPRSHRASLCGR